MLDEMNRLSLGEAIGWLEDWKRRALPYPELVRLLWRFATIPRESETEAYLVQIVDIGLLTENLLHHPSDTGWGIAQELLLRLLARRPKFLVVAEASDERVGLEQAWHLRRPDLAEWETHLVIAREGLSGLMEHLVKQTLHRDVGTVLPSLWRVSSDLASYWAGEDRWALMRLVSRWQALAANQSEALGLAGWTVEEGDMTRPLDFYRYFQGTLEEHLPSNPHPNLDQTFYQVYRDGQVQKLLQLFARVSQSLKTQDLRWLIGQLMVDALCGADRSTWDFLSRQGLGVMDMLMLSRAHRSQVEERHLVWSAWGWGLAALLAAGYRGHQSPTGVSATSGQVPVEDLWQAIDQGDPERSFQTALQLGDAVGELWPLLQEEVTVVGNPISIRLMAMATSARMVAPPMATHRVLPAVARFMALTRRTDWVGGGERSQSLKRPT